MNVIKDFISNFSLICVGTAWIAAQILKVCTGIFKEKSFNVIELLFGTGGMPSSHSAAVMALTVSIAIDPKTGVGSVAFAIAMLLTMIVMRDATGVRREAGEQAKVLNRIVADLFASNEKDDINRNLKELVGHTPLQVFVGAIVGVAVPFLVGLIPVFGIYG